MAIEPIKGFYVHDEVTDTDGVAQIALDAIEGVIQDDIAPAVTNWLDDHPEATTTVQDGAVTTPKLADGAVTEAKVDDDFLATIKNAYVTPEQFGAVGDGTTDDTVALQAALNTGLAVWCKAGAYKVNTQLVLSDGQELRGRRNAYASTVLIAPNGVKLAGSYAKISGIEIRGNGTGTAGLYCCGNNEGVAGGNTFTRNCVSDVFIYNFQYGIYFNAVAWDNKFENIRIFEGETGIYSTGNYELFNVLFSNIYFSGLDICDVNLKRSSCLFTTCNFGISAKRCLQFSQNCNISIVNSNFECDTHIESTTTIPLVEITGKYLKFTGCAFKMSVDANVSFLSTGAAVESVIFENCQYIGITLESADALNRFLLTEIGGANYGCIIFAEGCETIPVNIETSYRLPYGKYPYVKMRGLLQAYSDAYITLSNLKKGDMVYFYSDNTIKYYNGTQLV